MLTDMLVSFLKNQLYFAKKTRFRVINIQLFAEKSM